MRTGILTTVKAIHEYVRGEDDREEKVVLLQVFTMMKAG